MDLLLGMGRAGSGDDAAGIVLARTFHAEGWISVEVGTVPENAGGWVRRNPGARVVLVDAIDVGCAPGTVRRVRPEALESAGFGTHAPEPAMLDGYLRLLGAREIVWIGIQARSLEQGRGLSAEVRKALRFVAETLAGGTEKIAALPWLEQKSSFG